MTKIEETIRVIQSVLLVLLLFLTAISYHPTIIRMSRFQGYDSGTILSRYIFFLFIALFVISFRWRVLKQSHLVLTCLVWLGIISVFAVIVFAFFDNRDMFREIRALGIVLGAMMIGYCMRLDKKKIVFLIVVFSGTTLFSGIMQVLINNGGFRIADQYLTNAKNSLGAMLATSCFAFFFLSRFLSIRSFKNLSIILALLTFVVLVTIRARMAMVSLFLVVLYYLYLLTRNRNFIITLFVFFAILILGFVFMPSFFLEYLEASFTAGSQGEDITSGRMDTYINAIVYLAQNPLLGDVQKLNRIGWIHNYPLLKAYHFGLLFSWPILVLYVIIIVKAIKGANHSSPIEIVGFGCTCLLIPFLISMAEPTFPFGPGTVTLFNFVMFGLALRASDLNEYRI